MANIQLTQELVQHLFDYRDGFLYWKIRRQKVKIGSKAGHLHVFKKERRWALKISCKFYLNSRVIFLYHKGYLPIEVDHENRNPLDDRIENLRDASHSQNVKNASIQKDRKSKYKGVTLLISKKSAILKNGNKMDYISTGWRSRISIDGVCKYLGMFKSEQDAAKAYNEAALIYHKEFANLNIID